MRSLSIIRSLMSAAVVASTPSLESNVDGRRQRELEYTFYGKLANPEQLETLSFRKEKQEQWAVPLKDGSKGKLRVRRIDDKRCIVTTKIKRPQIRGCEEVECDISNDMFESLKEMGEGGYIKTRYFFKVKDSDLIWEIDVFQNEAGQASDWVKMDLEVNDEKDMIPDEPVDFTEIISHQSKDLTPMERQQIDDLWNRKWISLDAGQQVKEQFVIGTPTGL